MSYDKKLPPIRVVLTKEHYNKLVELITNINGLDIKDIQSKSIDIKEKLLKYPEIKDEKVFSRFFPSEIEYVLDILIFNSKNVSISNNYYEMLLNNKKKYKENLNKIEIEGGKLC